MNAQKSEKKLSLLGKIYDVVEIFAVAIVAVIVIFLFLGRLSTVDGRSMQHTLEDGEKLIISNLFYTPRSGDIIVFQQTDGAFSYPLVKRVIATGGQTLKIDFDTWTVWVDGKALDESGYVNYVYKQDNKTKTTVLAEMAEENYEELYADILDETGTMTIPEGYLFVMGDNRNASGDSRMKGVGLVNVNDVMGRVLIRLFPLGKFGAVD